MKLNKDDTNELLLGGALILGICLGVPALIFLSSVVRAFVLSTLWGWYIVPHFGLAPLPLIIAFGVSLVAGYLQFAPSAHSKGDRKPGEQIAMAIMKPLIYLLLGWAGTFFM